MLILYSYNMIHTEQEWLIFIFYLKLFMQFIKALEYKWSHILMTFIIKCGNLIEIVQEKWTLDKLEELSRDLQDFQEKLKKNCHSNNNSKLSWSINSNHNCLSIRRIRNSRRFPTRLTIWTIRFTNWTTRFPTRLTIWTIRFPIGITKFICL